MKTEFIPVEFHESYFMPAGSRSPSKREIGEYLSARHPLYGDECHVDRRGCLIAGRKYLLLTVLNITAAALRTKLKGARLVTVPAILAASRLAKKACTIRCGKELVTFGSGSESIRTGSMQEGTDKIDHEFDTGGDLLAFAAAEKIRISLFAPLSRLPAFFGIAFICVLFTAFVSVRAPNPVSIKEYPVTGPVPSITGASFTDNFAVVIAAAVQCGGTIADYLFSAEDRAETVLAFENGQPETLDAVLRNLPAIDDLTVKAIGYDENTWRYSASFSSPFGIADGAIHGSADAGAADFDERLRIFPLVRNFPSFCRSRGWLVTASSKDGLPVFVVSVPVTSFHLFPEALLDHCATNGLAVVFFHASRKSGLDGLVVELELAEGRERTAAERPETAAVRTAFGLDKNVLPDTSGTCSGIKSGNIGRIEDSSRGVFLFGKTQSGKITVRKEAEK